MKRPKRRDVLLAYAQARQLLEQIATAEDISQATAHGYLDYDSEKNAAMLAEARKEFPFLWDAARTPEQAGPAAASTAPLNGWAWTKLSRQRHFFHNGRSLCGRYGMLDAAPNRAPAVNKESNCWKCARRAARAARLEKRES